MKNSFQHLESPLQLSTRACRCRCRCTGLFAKQWITLEEMTVSTVPLQETYSSPPSSPFASRNYRGSCSSWNQHRRGSVSICIQICWGSKKKKKRMHVSKKYISSAPWIYIFFFFCHADLPSWAAWDLAIDGMETVGNIECCRAFLKSATCVFTLRGEGKTTQSGNVSAEEAAWCKAATGLHAGSGQRNDGDGGKSHGETSFEGG